MRTAAFSSVFVLELNGFGTRQSYTLIRSRKNVSRWEIVIEPEICWIIAPDGQRALRKHLTRDGLSVGVGELTSELERDRPRGIAASGSAGALVEEGGVKD